jgi:hypothetical protein
MAAGRARPASPVGLPQAEPGESRKREPGFGPSGFHPIAQELLSSVSQSRIKLNPNVIDARMTLMAIRTDFIGKRSRRRKHFGSI